MGGMRRGEKAKDFKGTMRQLLGYIGQHKIAVFAAVAFAVCSVIFNIVGPKVLGQVTTKLFEGLVAKVNGTGDVDFAWIAKTLGFLLCLYLASSVCSLIQGWLMTGVTQKICYRMRKEIAAKIAVVPMSYFNGHSKGDVLSRITNDVDTLGQSLNQSVTQLITSVTQIIGVLVMMLSISLPLTGVTVLTLPAAAIILMVMIHFSQPYFREQQQVLGTVNGIIEEDFAGQNVIQVFDRAEASIERRSELLARRSELLQRREEILSHRNIVHERIAQAFPALRSGQTNGRAFTRVHEHAQRRKELTKAVKAKAKALKNKAKDRT